MPCQALLGSRTDHVEFESTFLLLRLIISQKTTNFALKELVNTHN